MEKRFYLSSKAAPIALNGSRMTSSRPPQSVGLRHSAVAADQAIKLSFNDTVTLARGLFEALTVCHGHVASSVGDQARLLEHAGCDRNSRPARAQHLGHELLRQREAELVDPVVGQKEPPGEPLFDSMGPVTGAVLSQLCELGESVT